jgi:hypothetical protein
MSTYGFLFVGESTADLKKEKKGKYEQINTYRNLLSVGQSTAKLKEKVSTKKILTEIALYRANRRRTKKGKER